MTSNLTEMWRMMIMTTIAVTQVRSHQVTELCIDVISTSHHNTMLAPHWSTGPQHALSLVGIWGMTHLRVTLPPSIMTRWPGPMTRSRSQSTGGQRQSMRQDSASAIMLGCLLLAGAQASPKERLKVKYKIKKSNNNGEHLEKQKVESDLPSTGSILSALVSFFWFPLFSLPFNLS